MKVLVSTIDIRPQFLVRVSGLQFAQMMSRRFMTLVQDESLLIFPSVPKKPIRPWQSLLMGIFYQLQDACQAVVPYATYGTLDITVEQVSSQSALVVFSHWPFRETQ